MALTQLVQGLGGVIGKLFAELPFAKWCVGLAGAMLGFLLPTDALQAAGATAGILILVDTVTGLMRAWHTGDAIRSVKLRRVFVKIVGYMSVLFVAVSVPRVVPGLGGVTEASATGVVGLVVLTEGVSILENAVAMGLKLPFGLLDLMREKLGHAERGKADEEVEK